MNSSEGEEDSTDDNGDLGADVGIWIMLWAGLAPVAVAEDARVGFVGEVFTYAVCGL